MKNDMQITWSALFIVTMFLLALFVGCTDDQKARSVLQKQGFTNITITGYVFAACSDDDYTHTGFEAKNAQGQPVSGVVCCGFLKSCTVRW